MADKRLTDIIEEKLALLSPTLIAAELVLSAAAIRMTFVGYWPGRRFVLGPPAAAISVTAYLLATTLAVLL